MLTDSTTLRPQWKSAARTRPSSWMLAPLFAALPILVLAFSWVEIIDDAFISYRYAFNLISGQGLVFNRGEHVEGMTNLLWTLLMSIPIILRLPVHIVAAIVGVAFGFLAMIDA